MPRESFRIFSKFQSIPEPCPARFDLQFPPHLII
jgi:hypothetical protein